MSYDSKIVVKLDYPDHKEYFKLNNGSEVLRLVGDSLCDIGYIKRIQIYLEDDKKVR